MAGRNIQGMSAMLVVGGLLAASCAGSSAPDSAAPDAASTDPPPTGSVAAESSLAPPTETAPQSSAAPATPPETDASPVPRFMSGDSDYLFDQDQLHTFEIELPEESLADLDADPAAENYVEGSLSFEGEEVGPIGVRYKGSIGAFLFCTDGPNPLEPSGPKTCSKLSMKLKINWDDPNAEFYGVRKIQLHSQNLDASMMHERLGYWMFREMGVPAPRSTHARVMINGEFAGVFALTEQIDGRFTRENFSDGTGNLYKEVWPFDASGAARSDDDLFDGLKTNEDDDPSVELTTRFAEELLAADPEQAPAVLERWTDVDMMLRAFVVDRAIKNDDGGLHWYCVEECNPHNFYWYEDPSVEQVFYIPWDLDNAFDGLLADSLVGGFTEIADRWGDVSNDCEPFPFGTFGILQLSAACDPLIESLSSRQAEFDVIRAELLEGPFAAENVDEQLAKWTAQIESSVAEAAAKFDDAPSIAEWRAAVDALQASLVDARLTDGR